jgi:hypothetical protein
VCPYTLTDEYDLRVARQEAAQREASGGRS